MPANKESYFFKVAEPVYAFQLSQPIEIFRPDWQHKGKTGDWLIVKENEQYVVDAEVFSLSYEKI